MPQRRPGFGSPVQPSPTQIPVANSRSPRPAHRQTGYSGASRTCIVCLSALGTRITMRVHGARRVLMVMAVRAIAPITISGVLSPMADGLRFIPLHIVLPPLGQDKGFD